MSTRHRGSKTP